MNSLKILNPKMFGIVHISYPKIWVTIFIERWVSRNNFQFNIVLYNLGQHSLDSKFFQFLEAIPRGFLLSYFSHKFDHKELILRYYRTESWKFVVAENFYPKNGKFMLQILDKKNGFQGKFETPKSGMHTPIYKNGKYPSPLPRLVTSRINS